MYDLYDRMKFWTEPIKILEALTKNRISFCSLELPYAEYEGKQSDQAIMSINKYAGAQCMEEITYTRCLAQHQI